MTSPQSEADAIEAVARAISPFICGDAEFGQCVGYQVDGKCECTDVAQAALSAAKPHIEKALIKRMIQIAEKDEGSNDWIACMWLYHVARDLGYGDIGD